MTTLTIHYSSALQINPYSTAQQLLYITRNYSYQLKQETQNEWTTNLSIALYNAHTRTDLQTYVDHVCTHSEITANGQKYFLKTHKADFEQQS